jgi:hypothetical protein
MTRSLLNSLSTPQIMVIFGTLSVLVAVGATLLARRVVPDLAERRFEDLAEGLRVVFELLFALLLAFVIAAVLDAYSQAQGTVGSESAALSQMVRANQAFPVPDQVRLNAGVGAYVNAAVGKEWPAMREGRASPDAAAALDTLSALYTDFTPVGATQGEFYRQALSSLDAVSTARRDRLDIASSELPGVLRTMLIVGAMLLLVLEYRSTLSIVAQAVFMGTLALVVTTSYLLTVVVDFPFSGDVSVSPAPLTGGTLAIFGANPPRAKERGDRPLPLTASRMAGVWRSEAFGTVVLEPRDGAIRGVYRLAEGSIRGTIDRDGVFRGTWCEGPTRRPGPTPATSDAGLAEWRLVRTASEGDVLVGSWRYGYAHRGTGFVPDGAWDLRRLTADGAADLKRRLRTDPPALTCRAH